MILLAPLRDTVKLDVLVETEDVRVTVVLSPDADWKVTVLVEDVPETLGPSEKVGGQRLLARCRDPEEESWPKRNLIAGTEILLEDSPGNITVERTDKKVLIRVYGSVGRPMLIEEPIPRSDSRNWKLIDVKGT